MSSQNLVKAGAGLLTLSGFGAYAYSKYSKGASDHIVVHAANGDSESLATTTKESPGGETKAPEQQLLRRKTYNPRFDPNIACRPLIICGPSGAGKSTLIKKLVAEYPTDFGFSVSHTTRDPRTGEEDGVDYHFATMEDMLGMIKDGKFIEHAHVHDRIYGTSILAVTDVTKRRQICILDIDVQGVESVMASTAHKELMPKYLFIRPVSVDVLETRLLSRATDSLSAINQRVKTASFEMAVAAKLPFDQVIVNDTLDKAYDELKAFIDKERQRCKECREREARQSLVSK
jgi:guanylate kinase